MIRRRGRPQKVANPVRVTVRIGGADYDRLDEVARRTGRDVPDVIRMLISASKNIAADPPVHTEVTTTT